MAQIATNAKTLLNLTITTALTAQTSTAVDIGPDVLSLAVQYTFTYGSGGTTAKFWLQTTLDGGTTWIDIANWAGTTASETRAFNLSALTAVTTQYTVTDGTLTDDTAKDGIIGTKLRLKYTTTGTYAGSTSMKVTVVPKRTYTN